MDIQAMRCFYTSHQDEPLAGKMKEGIRVLRNCFDTEPRVSLCFNGGKDCTVVLHLARIALFEYLLGLTDEDGPEVNYDVLYNMHFGGLVTRSSISTLVTNQTIQELSSPVVSPAEVRLPGRTSEDDGEGCKVVYKWKRPGTSPFKRREFAKLFSERVSLVNFVPLDVPETPKELNHFVEDLEMMMGLEVQTVEAPSLIDGIRRKIDADGVKVFILGVRLDDLKKGKTSGDGGKGSDRSSNLIQPSTPPYPPLTRVFPILKWRCQDVWDFLIRFGVAYCPLYRQGYTSIGSSTSTPNVNIIARVKGTKELEPTLSERDALRSVQHPMPTIVNHVEMESDEDDYETDNEDQDGIRSGDFTKKQSCHEEEPKRDEKKTEVETIKSILEHERGLNMSGIEATHAVWMPATENERAGRE